ncbi:hypothetical protein NADFUDRAFT_25737 [Nadsonia fulvescens var. elongata DSM 6958]|uniref:Nucleolar protein 16 n=1 Tax=Nadsonia fulvescens var. elongata DSM 6958 TaxID=857566 RepID=A0A1E3PJT1_9ASCO|nr:hypothetical protein NADFUDRAFT_25737 [Nadsonia fulvescens var. elongata DSM 6958]
MPSGVRRRKTERSGSKKVTRKVKDKKREGQKLQTNAIISKYWDPKLSLTQNYKKLGLTSKIGTPAGGVEKEISLEKIAADKLAAEKAKNSKKLGPNEARIERDEDGNILRVVYGSENPGEDSDDEQEQNPVIRELEIEAARAIGARPRLQSEREADWVARMISKHGENYQAMFRDKNLNIWQQSVGDIKKRVIKWKKANNQL